MTPKVTIIILNYKGLDDTVECLESLKKIDYPNYETIVVDNNEDSAEADALWARYDHFVTVITNGDNAGFAEGNNIGIRYARDELQPDYYLLLNNDTIVDKGLVAELVKVAEESDGVGAVAAKIRMYYDPQRIESTGLAVNMWTGVSRRRNWRAKDADGRFDNIRYLDAASTNGFLIPRSTIEKIGLFDKDVFIYHDDVDFCLRARKAGLSVLFAPGAVIWHKVGAATRKTTGLPQYYIARNNFRFMKRNATRLQYLSFLTYYVTLHAPLMTLAYILYFRSLKVAVRHLQGVWDGLHGRTGRAKL